MLTAENKSRKSQSNCMLNRGTQALKDGGVSNRVDVLVIIKK